MAVDHRCSYCQEYDYKYCSVCKDAVQGAETMQTISVSFTIKELETMLNNAKAGGSVEVVITVNHQLIIR